MTNEPSLPWLRPSSPAKPARDRLTAEGIVDAAYTVLDRDGYDKLSMRAVAGELGVAVSSLYAHVTNKDELLHKMWLRAFLDVRMPDPPEDLDEWAATLRGWAFAVRDALRAHRDLARVSMGQHPFVPEALPHLERIVAYFRAAGLPDDLVLGAGDFLSTFIDGWVYEEQMWEDRVRRLVDGGEVTAEGFDRQIAEYFSSLDPAEFPQLSGLAGANLRHTDQNERFGQGVDAFIRGLMTRIPGEDDRGR